LLTDDPSKVVFASRWSNNYDQAGRETPQCAFAAEISAAERMQLLTIASSELSAAPPAFSDAEALNSSIKQGTGLNSFTLRRASPSVVTTQRSKHTRDKGDPRAWPFIS
jgi:hypothetical protein